MKFVVKCQRGKYSDKWVVFADGKVCTEGNVWYCLDWVKATRARLAGLPDAD